MEELVNLFHGFAVALQPFNIMVMVLGIVLGVIIGVLPGAGADMAAWMSYATSKKFSKEPEKFGTGHVEGIVDEQWHPVDSSTRQSWRELRVGLQLANRQGPVSEDEVERFREFLDTVTPEDFTGDEGKP